MRAIARRQPNFLLFGILFIATATVWWTNNPSFPASDCGKNEWLVLSDGKNAHCVRGVLPKATINEAYRKALEQYRRDHAADPRPDLPGVEVDDMPYNLIDEVIVRLTKGWNLR